jgi:hypothetical protein
MALRRFRGASSSSTVVFTGQAFTSRELLDTGSATGSNGSSVTLAAGASASFYLITATGIPNLTTGLTGSWEAAIQFQTTTPTNIFCKFRVHRISVAGTVPTILASTEYSAEIQARATNTPYIISTDGTDLGTFSSGHRVAVEWTIRNAGASSISPAPSFGTYSRFVRTPIESSAAVGWTGFVGQAAYRPISYSEGTINGAKRTGSVKNSITSTGTATGTKGGSDFSGSVTGISTSSGTIAAGIQGYSGSSVGISTSSGAIAAGTQGYAGTVTGASTSAGVIGAGTQGYDGATNGVSTSTGSAKGTPNPQPQPDEPLASTMRVWNQDYHDEPQRVIHARGKTNAPRIYLTGDIFGVAGFNGYATSVTNSVGYTTSLVGYYGSVRKLELITRHRARGKARPDLRENRELLLLIGEL